MNTTPFGTLIASTGSTPNNHLFSGEQFDPTLSVYQLQARCTETRQ